MKMLGSLFKDLLNVLLGTSPINAITGNGTITGTIINVSTGDLFLLELMTGTITDGSHEIQVWIGDDPALADGVEVDASDLNGSLPTFVAANDDKVASCEVILRRAYLRVDIVSTGVTTGGTIAMMGKLRELSVPVTQPGLT